jgi:hypothetical protein
MKRGICRTLVFVVLLGVGGTLTAAEAPRARTTVLSLLPRTCRILL